MNNCDACSSGRWLETDSACYSEEKVSSKRKNFLVELHLHMMCMVDNGRTRDQPLAARIKSFSLELNPPTPDHFNGHLAI